jgi:long-chain acyl-CoA synthetase
MKGILPNQDPHPRLLPEGEGAKCISPEKAGFGGAGTEVDKIWLKHYPPGMPEHIPAPEAPSLAEFFEAAVARYGDRPALSSLGRVLTYAQLDEASRQFAAFLQDELRLEPGERIALMLPNILQHPVAFWGALRAGLVVVEVNPLYTARELEHQLRDADVAALVVLENFTAVVAEVLARRPVRAVVVARLGDLLLLPRRVLVNWYARHGRQGRMPTHVEGAVSFVQALHDGARRPFRRAERRPEDPALIQYTGGTTGVSKGAILSHGNLLANIAQSTAWVGGSLPPERALGRGEDIVVTALPLYHIFALTVDLLCFTELGALNVLIANPRDVPRMLRDMGQFRFTALVGVNTLFKVLLDTPEFEKLDFSALKLVIGGGMPVERTVARRWLAVTGCPITEGYGLTEASPVVSINPANAVEFTGSIGQPLPSTECGIRDEMGEPVPPGRPGELWVRGPQVMQGYRNRPDETQAVLGPDGWLRTGDIARMDERGYLYLVDRSKDMILVSGFNVYPNEIEAVLGAHPGIRECAAVGVPDPKTGEAVKVFVVCRDAPLDAETVRHYCRLNLAAYKVPKYVEFRDSLPKSPIGKVLRRELRKQA